MKYILPTLLAVILLTTIVIFTNKAISATSHIVISEIKLGISGATTDEFVELYNPTSSNVDLTGWKLSRKSSSGLEGNLIASMSGTIPAFGFFLTAHFNSTSSQSADLLFTSNSVAPNNSVIIYDETEEIVDKVGIGPSGTDPEGSPSSSLDNNGKSIERKANSNSTSLTLAIGGIDEFLGNGEDSGNNFNDFVIRDIPQPQNSQSEKEPQVTPSSTPTPTEEITPTTQPEPTETIEPTLIPTEIPTPTPTEEVQPTEPQPTETIEPTSIPTATPTEVEPTEIPVPTPTEELQPTETPITITPTPNSNHFFIKVPRLVCEFTSKRIKVGFLRLSIPNLSCKVTSISRL